jgi:hypothetical protein
MIFLILIYLAAGASEFMLQDGNEEQDRLDQQQMEQKFWERVQTLQTKSRRVEKARTSPNAMNFFHREPNAREGYDTMWVSAIDNACFKSLVGNFRNYGIEFADNFGDWQDGCPEDGLVSIEDMAAFKARKVYEATGLPCIASRTSFEIEPVPPSSSSSSSSMSQQPPGPMSQQPPGRQASSMSSSPRVTSGYRINDIGMNVEYLCDALRPLSEPTRVTRFRTCLCFYDGEMEIFDYGVCDVDIYFTSSMRTFIAMAQAINGMLQTLQLTFGLEYQKFLKDKFDQSLGAYGGGSMKLRDRVLKDGKVLPNDIIDVSTFMDSQVDVNLMDDCARELVSHYKLLLFLSYESNNEEKVVE